MDGLFLDLLSLVSIMAWTGFVALSSIGFGVKITCN